MENGTIKPKAFSLRWEILRQALLRRSRLRSEEDAQSQIVDTKSISRKSNRGFNLIRCRLRNDDANKNSSSSSSSSSTNCQSRDVTVCYTLTVEGSPQLVLSQRLKNLADLSDFEFCNEHDIDNTCPENGYLLQSNLQEDIGLKSLQAEPVETL